VLELKEVKLVDRTAVRFLAQCEVEGTKLWKPFALHLAIPLTRSRTP
jgi:hypothetical protein